MHGEPAYPLIAYGHGWLNEEWGELGIKDINPTSKHTHTLIHIHKLQWVWVTLR
jgi:hypothetical protein